MTWELTGYSVALFVAALITGTLTVVAWRNRDEPAALPATVLLAAMSSRAFVEGVRIGFTTLGAQLSWYRLGLTIGVITPAAWFVFTLAYAGYERLLTRRVLVLLLIEPLAFATLVWTNSFHHLVWTHVGLATHPVPHLVRTFDIGYYLHIGYVYVLVGGGILLLLRVFWQASAIYRRQTGLLVAGALLPLIVHVGFVLHLSPVPELDVTSLTFAISGIVFGVALFKFELLNLNPVAQAQLATTLGSGLIVLNADERVTYVNETAQTIFPKVTVGVDIQDALDIDAVDSLAGQTVQADSDGQRRFYDAHVSELTDFRGRAVGNLIALRDITERREYEQRLEVANRLLRHNLRNDTAKLVGWADQVQERAQSEDVRALGNRIETVAWELSGLSEKAQYLETTLVHEYTPASVNLTSVLEDIVADLRTKWPDAELSLDTPEAVYVRAQNRGLLEAACRNVIENGIEHNDADTPRIRIRVSRIEKADTDTPGEYETDERVIVEVTDNGPGIPDIELETLHRGTETPLQHGGGLGLWVVNWIIDGADGEMDFEENEPRGSIVTLKLRPAPAPEH